MESWREELYASDYGSQYLMHGRTYGSKNGISHTKNYDAIGTLAKVKDTIRRNRIKRTLKRGIESYEVNNSDQMFLADRARALERQITMLKQNHADAYTVRRLEKQLGEYQKAINAYSEAAAKASAQQAKAYVQSEAYKKAVKAADDKVKEQQRQQKEAERQKSKEEFNAKTQNIVNAVKNIFGKETSSYASTGKAIVDSIVKSKEEKVMETEKEKRRGIYYN